MIRIVVFIFSFSLFLFPVSAQDLLPPVNDWRGKSLELIARPNHEFITVAEKSSFTKTSTYDETIQWFDKLAATTSKIKKVTIGKTLQGRDIVMIIASSENSFDATSLRRSSRPLLLMQAGIHAGEIDGKDAGMMLLRDITTGSKENLLTNVNIAFIPMLSPDGHERSSSYNRINQRGPENAGWRANAKNLNLNRDYTKLDTEEIRAVVNVINTYDPDLYLDLHVTDGEDYQYDITYGFVESSLVSPAISQWLQSSLQPSVDASLKMMGHIPGPVIFSYSGGTLEKGNAVYNFPPRFSNVYGDVRHLPSILVENHSLKPYRQRVLGTYVFIESVLQKIGTQSAELQAAIAKDEAMRSDSLALTYKQSSKAETQSHLGIESRTEKSTLSAGEFQVWTGKKKTMDIPVIRQSAPDKKIRVPKTYWVPSTYPEVIERLKAHGIKMETVQSPQEVSVSMYRVTSHQFERRPEQGHMIVKGEFSKESRKEVFYPGSVKVSTDQELGSLVSFLLEPESPDSFFRWGFFLQIFDRVEYAESYVLEPLAQQMLKDKQISAEFENWKAQNPTKVSDQRAIYEWFYLKSPYKDDRELLYPVGIEY